VVSGAFLWACEAWSIPMLRDLLDFLSAPPRCGHSELLMEYAGEVLREHVADAREAAYGRAGLGVYFFRLDADHVVDATKRGNISRFMNHSCRWGSPTSIAGAR
jgi:SET domain-containing protein